MDNELPLQQTSVAKSVMCAWRTSGRTRICSKHLYPLSCRWLVYRLQSTPLLLAASSGALSSLQCLIELGADVLHSDQLGNNVINLAALRCHANILEFFSVSQQPQLDVWLVLVGQLFFADTSSSSLQRRYQRYTLLYSHMIVVVPFYISYKPWVL